MEEGWCNKNWAPSGGPILLLTFCTDCIKNGFARIPLRSKRQIDVITRAYTGTATERVVLKVPALDRDYDIYQSVYGPEGSYSHRAGGIKCAGSRSGL